MNATSAARGAHGLPYEALKRTTVSNRRPSESSRPSAWTSCGGAIRCGGFLADFERSDHAQRLKLGPLELEDVAEQITDITGERPAKLGPSVGGAPAYAFRTPRSGDLRLAAD